MTVMRAQADVCLPSSRHSYSAICFCPGAHSTAEVLALRSRALVSRAGTVGSTRWPLRMLIAPPAAFVAGRGSGHLVAYAYGSAWPEPYRWLPVGAQMT